MPEQERSRPLANLPSTLRWAVGLIGLEAVAVVVLAAVLAYDALTGPSQSATSAIALIVFALLLGGVFGLLSAALSRQRRWARGPAFVLELLLLPIGYSIATSGPPAVGVALIVIGLAGLATLIAPATRAALELQ